MKVWGDGMRKEYMETLKIAKHIKEIKKKTANKLICHD